MNVNPYTPYFRMLRRLYGAELMLITFIPELRGRAAGSVTSFHLLSLLELSRARRDWLENCGSVHGISIAGDDCEQFRNMIDRERAVAEPDQGEDALLLTSAVVLLSFVQGNLKTAWKTSEDLLLRDDATSLAALHGSLAAALSSARTAMLRSNPPVNIAA